MYFSTSCGQFDVQPPVFGVGDALESDQLADAIDVALHDVAAEAAVGFHGKFKIHQRAFVNAREGSAHPGLGREIGAERSRLDVERGEADSADRYAVAGFEFFRSMLGGDGDAAVFAALLDADDASDFFHDAGKHEGLRMNGTS